MSENIKHLAQENNANPEILIAEQADIAQENAEQKQETTNPTQNIESENSQQIQENQNPPEKTEIPSQNPMQNVERNSEHNLVQKTKVEPLNEEAKNMPRTAQKPFTPQSSNDFMSTLAITINQYETLLNYQQQNLLDTSKTQEILSFLKKHITPAMQTKKKPENSSKQEIMKHEYWAYLIAEDIFHYYNKQHLICSPNHTFDSVVDNMERIPLAYFIRFIRDFDIPVSKKDEKMLFIKYSILNKYMEIPGFLKCLTHISKDLHSQRISKYNVSILEKQSKIEELKKIQITEPKYGETLQMLEDNLKKMQDTLSKLKNYAEKDIVSNFYKMLGFYDQSYKGKLKGFSQIPFNVSEVSLNPICTIVNSKFRNQSLSMIETSPNVNESRLTIPYIYKGLSKYASLAKILKMKPEKLSKTVEFEDKPINVLHFKSQPITIKNKIIVSPKKEEHLLKKITKNASIQVDLQPLPTIEKKISDKHQSMILKRVPFERKKPIPKTIEKIDLFKSTENNIDVEDNLAKIFAIQNEKMEAGMKVVEKTREKAKRESYYNC